MEKKFDSFYQHHAFLQALKQYLRGGNMPFSLDEPDIFPLLENILNTIIQKDIPKTARLLIDELELIKKTVTFIGRSGVDGINYSSISKNIGITKYKAQSYIDLLENAFVLHKILPIGTNVLKEPKILLAPPFRLLFKEYDDCVGELREDFFIEMLKSSGCEFSYLKSTRGAKTPDFMVNDGKNQIVVEIGGHGKGREQFKGLKAKKQLIFTHSSRLDGIRRPLYLAGFMA